MPNVPLIWIKGAGDLATGVAFRLHRAGYRLLMTELAHPKAVRLNASFALAAFLGSSKVDDLTAVLTTSTDFERIQSLGHIPLVVDAEPSWLENLPAQAVSEATMRKHNYGIIRKPGRLTLALGPGFEAGIDVDGVIETNRGPHLGRFIVQGCALPNTGVPAQVLGYGIDRVLRSPSSGIINFTKVIGDRVLAGERLGSVDSTPFFASISGVLRGAIFNGSIVSVGEKIGDIDPRPEAANYIFKPSDKALAVGGGVLECLSYYGIIV
jgi:xanthine dehydrogenase accessory factor